MREDQIDDYIEELKMIEEMENTYIRTPQDDKDRQIGRAHV